MPGRDPKKPAWWHRPWVVAALVAAVVEFGKEMIAKLLIAAVALVGAAAWHVPGI
jgi:hypothetical protein